MYVDRLKFYSQRQFVLTTRYCLQKSLEATENKTMQFTESQETQQNGSLRKLNYFCLPSFLCTVLAFSALSYFMTCPVFNSYRHSYRFHGCCQLVTR